MSWHPNTIRAKFKQMYEAIEDMARVYTFDALCLEIGITKSIFEQQTELFKEIEWFKAEYEKIIDILEQRNIKLMVSDPSKTAAIKLILERYFGWAKDETESIDTGEVHVTRTIIQKRLDDEP